VPIGPYPHQHSFPTRRSSDLDYIGTEHLLLGMIREGEGVAVGVLKKLGVPLEELRAEIEKISKGTATHEIKNLANIPLTKASERSEEHTSELQSRENLVCRLL